MFKIVYSNVRLWKNLNIKPLITVQFYVYKYIIAFSLVINKQIKTTYFKINFLAFEYKILLMEHMVIAGKSILLSSYRGLSKTICIDEYEKVSHDAKRLTIIVTIATTIKVAHINLYK